MGWKVEVEIQLFLVHRSFNSTINEPKGKVEEDSRVGARRTIPTELSEGVEFGLKGRPASVFSVVVTVGDPDGENVVNISNVVRQRIIVKQPKLVNPKVDSSVGRCWWCAHGGAINLSPKGVAKLEDVRRHDEFQGSDDCIGGEVMADRVASKERSKNRQRMMRVDVGVH